MEKKRWSLILMALCLALVFSVSSVEAQDPCDMCEKCDRDGDGLIKNNRPCRDTCNVSVEEADDNDGEPNMCGGGGGGGGSGGSGGGTGPIIAIVANKFPVGYAVGFIMAKLGGTYINVSLRDFNRLPPQDLRDIADVLYIQWGSPSSMRVTWSKLLGFMNAVPGGDSCTENCIGGGILHEDPQNVLELEVDGLDIEGVEHHAGNDGIMVEWVPPPSCINPTLPSSCYVEPLEILSAFTAPMPEDFNNSGYFAAGTTSNCASNIDAETVQTLGLGYGCLVNNHMTFAYLQESTDPFDLTPLTGFLKLDGSSGEAVGLYGEFVSDPPDPLDPVKGRIHFTGPDSAVHSEFVASPFHANAFCLTTNQLIWLSQLPVTDESLARAAMDECVENAKTYRMDQGQLQ